jgi:hypothetical protein
MARSEGLSPSCPINSAIQIDPIFPAASAIFLILHWHGQGIKVKDQPFASMGIQADLLTSCTRQTEIRGNIANFYHIQRHPP